MFQLSEAAQKMLNQGIRHSTITKKDDVIKQLTAQGHHAFDAVVEFQTLFGGIEYYNGPNGGMILGIFQNSNNQPIIHTVYDRECFECARFHDNIISLFMCEDGYILINDIFGELEPCGESIVNQIEIDVIGELIKKECSQWMGVLINNQEFSRLLSNKKKGLHSIEEYSSKHTAVWTNCTKSVYIICYDVENTVSPGYYVYAKTTELLNQFVYD